MGLGDALDRLDQRVLARYPWLWREPKRPFLFKLLWVLALGVTSSLTRLAHGGTWADVRHGLVLYLAGMVLLSPLLIAISRHQARRRAARSGEPRP